MKTNQRTHTKTRWGSRVASVIAATVLGTAAVVPSASAAPADVTTVVVTPAITRPVGIVVVGTSLIVSETENHVISKIDSAGNVTLLAGTPGVAGATDGPALSARFYRPHGIGLDGSGNVLIADEQNGSIRKLNLSTNVVSTVGTGFSAPTGVAVDSSGNIFVVAYGSGSIHKVTVSTSSTATIATGLNRPLGVTVSATGDIVVGGGLDNLIHKINPTTFAMTTLAGTGAYGSSNGPAASATFAEPGYPTFDAAGNLFITELAAGNIRKIDTSGNVTTVAGTGSWGFVNGPATTAQFSRPFGIAIDGGGNIFIADYQNWAVRKIEAVAWPYPVGTSRALLLFGASGAVAVAGITHLRRRRSRQRSVSTA
jgi:serine/threonine protein kinase, bacterial